MRLKTEWMIRRMQEQDVEQVVLLEKRMFSVPWTANDFLESLDNPQHLYLVVENQGEIIAYCGLWVVLDEGQITNVAVKEEYQRHGIGKTMLKRLLEESSELGAKAFTLEVRVSNYKAIALYEKLGFTKEGQRKNFYDKPLEDAIIMWCYL